MWVAIHVLPMTSLMLFFMVFLMASLMASLMAYLMASLLILPMASLMASLMTTLVASLMADPPRNHGLTIVGSIEEGETVTATEVMEESWQKFRKEVRFQWYRVPGGTTGFDALAAARECSYLIGPEDVGGRLRCICTVVDIYGRTTPELQSTTPVVAPGQQWVRQRHVSTGHVSATSVWEFLSEFQLCAPTCAGQPRVENVEVEGRGFHTSLYTVKGVYCGGREGRSRVQWLRLAPNKGEEEAVPIGGEEGRSYEANAEDVGCRLLVRYTPVREDGVEGQPQTATSPVIEIGEL